MLPSGEPHEAAHKPLERSYTRVLALANLPQRRNSHRADHQTDRASRNPEGASASVYYCPFRTCEYLTPKPAVCARGPPEDRRSCQKRLCAYTRDKSTLSSAHELAQRKSADKKTAGHVTPMFLQCWQDHGEASGLSRQMRSEIMLQKRLACIRHDERLVQLHLRNCTCAAFEEGTECTLSGPLHPQLRSAAVPAE